MINFKLKDTNQIQPVGQAPNVYLSWFWLTDGELWLTFGNTTIYEYAQEAITHFGNQSLSRYNDYYIVRFLEDFSSLFEKISSSLPTRCYRLTADLKSFTEDAKRWFEAHETDDGEMEESYADEYDRLIGWVSERLLDSGHLVGGPNIAFFRQGETIRIAWETSYAIEDGIDLWSAKDGYVDMGYAEFVDRVKRFGNEFFAAMDRQVEQALAIDWGSTKLDKANLVKEHRERKAEFLHHLSFLERDREDSTDWNDIERLLDQMEH